MRRREFCRTTLAASFTAAYPLLTACGKEAPVATQVDTSIAAISLDGAEIELEKAAIRELGDALMGPVLLSGHPDYDSARMVWNGMHDKRPALIAMCSSSDNIRQAVTFARERDLLTAVRGGGHSWPGKLVCDGGLMINLAQMHDVAVDPGMQRAVAGGGTLLHGLDTAALSHGLITTAGVVSHTGVGGFTLGGGFGRVDELATAFPHRNAETMVMVGGGWMDPTQDDEAIAIARGWFQQLEPFTGGYYDNIQADTAAPSAGSFGPAYDRLARIKGRYDPGNLFRLNRNIQPAT